MIDFSLDLLAKKDPEQIIVNSQLVSSCSKGNCSKEELSLLTEKELLSKVSGWKYKTSLDGLCLEEKNSFMERMIMVDPYKIAIRNGNFICKGRCRRTLKTPIKDILQFYLTREFLYCPGEIRSLYELRVVFYSGEHCSVAVFKDLCNAHIFEIILERRLGIQDRLVLGEYNDMPQDTSETIENTSQLQKETVLIKDKVFCPKCKLVLDATQEEISQSINHSCRFCNETFDSKHKERAMLERGGIDKLLSMSMEHKDLILTRKHKPPYCLFLIILLSFFILLTLYSFIDNPGDSPIKALLMLPLLFIYVALLFMVYNNSTVVRVSENSINTRLKPYEFLGRISETIPNSEINQIFVKCLPTVSSERSKALLCVLKNDGTEVVIDRVNGIRLDRAVNILHSMEVFIEKRLGIEDKTVSTEIL